MHLLFNDIHETRNLQTSLTLWPLEFQQTNNSVAVEVS